MRDALFMGSTWRALKIPVTFMAGFQSLALRVLKQPLCWAPVLPEAQFLLRISGRVTIIPLSPTCTRHKPPSGLSSVLLIVKSVSLFFCLPSFPFLFLEWVFVLWCSVASTTDAWKKMSLYWLAGSFSEMGERAPSVYSVSLWDGDSWDLLDRLEGVKSSAQVPRASREK